MALRDLKNRYDENKKRIGVIGQLMRFFYRSVFFSAPLILVAGILLFNGLRPQFQLSQHGAAIAVDAATEVSSTVQQFKDVDAGHPDFLAINYLKKQDIVEGYADGTFKPGATLTRAEFLKFLFEAQKIYPSPAIYRACFLDVKDQWFAPYICYAKAKNLLGDFVGGKKRYVDAGEFVKVGEAIKIVLAATNLDRLNNFTAALSEDALITRAQLAEILYSLAK